MARTTRIHTMRPDERGDTLDEIARTTVGITVMVDFERVRNISAPDSLRGNIFGVATNPSGPDHLVVKPTNPGMRLHSIPATTIVRIWNPRTREVYAGPALPAEDDDE